MRLAITVILWLGLSSVAQADGWSSLGHHAEMLNSVIADAGDVLPVRPPPGIIWDHDVYQLNKRCFYIDGLVNHWGSASVAGLLLVDKWNNVQVALLDVGASSINADVEPVTMVDCPNPVAAAVDEGKAELRQLKQIQEENRQRIRHLKEMQEMQEMQKNN